MGRRERRKGASGEREFFAALSRGLGVTVRRRLGQARDGGCDGVSPGRIAWEVKRRRTIAVCRWLAQAQRAAERIPASERPHAAVACREDGSRTWVVVLTLDTFLTLISPRTKEACQCSPGPGPSV